MTLQNFRSCCTRESIKTWDYHLHLRFPVQEKVGTDIRGNSKRKLTLTQSTKKLESQNTQWYWYI